MPAVPNNDASRSRPVASFIALGRNRLRNPAAVTPDQLLSVVPASCGVESHRRHRAVAETLWLPPSLRRHDPRGRNDLKLIVPQRCIEAAFLVGWAQFGWQRGENRAVIRGSKIRIIRKLGRNERAGTRDDRLAVDYVRTGSVYLGIFPFNGRVPAQLAGLGWIWMPRIDPGTPVFQNPQAFRRSRRVSRNHNP